MATTPTVTCVHHWVIQPASPGTTTSSGTCQKCSLTQEFRNSVAGEWAGVMAKKAKQRRDRGDFSPAPHPYGSFDTGTLVAPAVEMEE